MIGGLAIFWLAGQFYGVLVIRREMRLCVIALCIAALLAPEWALGGWGVHLRLPGVLGAMVFASAEVRLPRRLAMAIAAVLLAALAASAATLAANWQGYDRQYTEFRAALRGFRKACALSP